MSVNRQAWAALVARLVDEEAKGNKSRFARLVDVEYKTINRWIRGEVDVSEESVRKVARGLGRSPIKLLIEAGYYSPEDLAEVRPLPPPDEDMDPVLLAIHDAAIPPHKKVELVDRIIERRNRLRERQQEDEMAEVRWWIQQQRGA